MVKYWKATLVAGAAAAFLAACGGGGGGGGGGSADPQSSNLQLSGTAATGLALVGSNVDVKCAAGTGTATTNDTGAYTVTVTNGTLPCIIKVTGTADGAPVTLHSVAEAGTTSGSTTTAVANVTPLTEMIVAQLAAAAPATYFDTFGASTTITPEQLTAATSTLLTALETATGIALAVDPFKATLIPATATTAGNAYDDVLEALKAKVSLEALPLIVSQVASSAAGASTGNGPTLASVMTAVNTGNTCASVANGSYRLVEYDGFTQVITLDFTNKVLTAGVDQIPFTASTTQACQYSFEGDVPATVVFGPSGVGALQDDGTIGYLFPVQSHPASSFLGEWNYVESGLEEDNTPIHFVGKYTFNTLGVAGQECGYYDSLTGLGSNCEVDDQFPIISDNGQGGVFLDYGNTDGPMYGYRAPNGSFFAFGTTNPDDANGPGTIRSHFILYKAAAAPVPAVGTTVKYWDVLAVGPNAANPTLAYSTTADQTTVTAVDGTTIQRTRASDGRVDTLRVNDPLPGFRAREAGTNFRATNQALIPGLGVALSLNINESAGTPHLYGISITRP